MAPIHKDLLFILFLQLNTQYIILFQWVSSLTQRHSVWGGLSVEPEPDPGENDNESAGQVDLKSEHRPDILQEFWFLKIL